MESLTHENQLHLYFTFKWFPDSHTPKEREREREKEQEESTEKQDMGPDQARRPILTRLTPRERRPIPQAKQGEGTLPTHSSSSSTQWTTHP